VERWLRNALPIGCGIVLGLVLSAVIVHADNPRWNPTSTMLMQLKSDGTGIPVEVGPSNPLQISAPNPTAMSGTILTQTQTSAANASLVVTLTGVAAKKIHLYGTSVNCSGGTASYSMTDGGTSTFSLNGNIVPTAPQILSIAYTSQPYTSLATGNNLVITVGPCGATFVSTLNVQADQF